MLWDENRMPVVVANDWSGILRHVYSEICNGAIDGPIPRYEKVVEAWVAASNLDDGQKVVENICDIPAQVRHSPIFEADSWSGAVSCVWECVQRNDPNKVEGLVKIALGQQGTKQLGLSAFSNPNSWTPIEEWLKDPEISEDDIEHLKAKMRLSHPDRFPTSAVLQTRAHTFALELFSQFPRDRSRLGELFGSVIDEAYFESATQKRGTL